MESPTGLDRLRLAKDAMLVVSVLYFYALGALLLFQIPTFGLEHLVVFFTMSMLFLFAVVFEAILAWWNKRRFLAYAALGVVTYAVIGLYVAPTLYGNWVRTLVMLEPLIIVFVGGFVLLFGKSVADAIFPKRALNKEELARTLITLPGWDADQDAICKIFQFDDEGHASIFLRELREVAEKKRHAPQVTHNGNAVRVCLSTEHPSGVTHLDIETARMIDAL